MTKDEAIELQVGKDKVFVVEPRLEEIFEMSIVGIELSEYSRMSSDLKITAISRASGSRVYSSNELYRTELEALQRLSEIHQFRSDQALNKKHHIVAKIAKLKKKVCDE